MKEKRKKQQQQKNNNKQTKTIKGKGDKVCCDEIK